MKPKILVSRALPETVEARLAYSFDATFNKTDAPMTAAVLCQAMRDYDALVPTVSDRIDAEVLLTHGRRVGMIANIGVGYSNIDTDIAREAGIRVSNTPDVLTDATADIALLLILAATRRSYAAETKLRQNRWGGFSIVDGLGSSIQGKILGIVGMGRIGRATARRAALGFGMNVVFYNRSSVDDLDFEATQLGSIDAVLSQADVVSIHVPGGSTPLVTAEHIAAMKPSAYLVNTARGDSIDQTALIDALSEGRIAGAGLDVFEAEPFVPDVLRELENVTLLPHIGSATTEVRTAMGMLAADNLEAFFAGKDLPCTVV
ncbi:2-hydroxyacid dehydrogenase [Phaeobacter sp. C3_T13_0]|uniref:2-hydroxyacid dehydrogenase n=1 Tax=Phaeobacter cretensis TaxID=3342641 RepID=UPI0039BD9277